MIGKTYWKSVALPSALHGAIIISFNNQDNIDKSEKTENTVLYTEQYWKEVNMRLLHLEA